jgi:subtilisin family serine protease
VIDRVSIQRTAADALLSFEWIIDPDGDPNTNWDVPAACSNSWGLATGHGYPPCDQLFWSHLDANEAAGTMIIFSAGNEGFSGLRRPSDRATDDYRTLAVAAVDANQQGWPIASFSSRGPTNCTPNGQPAIKPDISGPGVNVISSVPGNGYAAFSGTSMASPHINGVVCLMREVNPDLPVNDLKQIIFDTAFDLGTEGEDNNYGWGMVDAYEAVVAAISGEIPMRLVTSRFVAGVNGDAEVFRATPGATVVFVYSLQGAGSTYVPQLDVTLDLAQPQQAGVRTADQDGYALLRKRLPSNGQGLRVFMQAAEFQRKSNVTEQVIE